MTNAKTATNTMSIRSYSIPMRAVTGIGVGLVLVFCCQFYVLSRLIDSSASDHRVLRTTKDTNDILALKDKVSHLLATVQDKQKAISVLQRQLDNCQRDQSRKEESTVPNATNIANKNQTRLHATMSSYLHGTCRIPKSEFLETFDYGLPKVMDDDREAGQSEVLLLYNTEASLPASSRTSNVQVGNGDGFAGPLLTVEEATAKCKTINVVSIGNPNESSDMFVGGQCLALVGHEQMYHVQRFVQKDDNSFDLVQRETIQQRKTGDYIGQYKFESEDQENSPARLHREFLAKYLPQIDTLKSRLEPILKEVAINDTVVVMVCNKDQSTLLHNFACACRAKGIQMRNAIVFPTDKETDNLARELGFATFYDEEIFGRDADAMYKTIVLRKVVAVHLVNLLGFDLLFQDVDIVYYRDPLQLFQNPNHTYCKFDVLFADDGARWVLTLPYSANTGFFFARHNERTRHLFRSWLFNLDILYANNGDQPVMKTILPEESSLTGLRIKILDGDDFPCGNRINQIRHREYIQDVMQGKRNSTYILHVNWNHGEPYKRSLMKQMGTWYARNTSTCRDDSLPNTPFLSKCCSDEPLVSCHIPDKPSLIPCEEEDWKES